MFRLYVWGIGYMNKLVAVLCVVIVLLSAMCGFLFYQISDVQNQNNILQNQMSQLEKLTIKHENQIRDIESQLSSIATQNIEIQTSARTLIAQRETPYNESTVIDGNATANITIDSPKGMAYSEDNVSFIFTIYTDVEMLEDFTPRLFGLLFRYGCVLDSNLDELVAVYATSGWDFMDRGTPSKPGLVPDSNVDVNLTRFENSYVGNGTLTNLSEGFHNITVLMRVEQSYISTNYYQWAVFSTVTFKVDATPPNVSILSPKTKFYEPPDVPLFFTVNEVYFGMYYNLDGTNRSLTDQNVTLTQLSSGEHTVTVYVFDEAGNIGSSETICFTVDSPPTVSLMFPENETYYRTEIGLNYAISESVSEITYCLDGQENVTIDGYAVLTELRNGRHTITVYATNENGNTGASETINFTVKSTFPILFVVTVTAVIVLTIILLIYLKKHKW